jgi:hypothetical protein
MDTSENSVETGAPVQSLPPKLAHAISDSAGGRVVLVVGAGVSIEAPTSLPTAADCAAEAHRRLVLDSVLAVGRCADPRDLAAVADAVFEETSSQQPLVDRLPVARFIGAQPNDGHLLASALLRERAIASILTLNFDLAISTALNSVGASDDVARVRGPEDTRELSQNNLIYLHRTAEHDAADWVLRSESLTSEWVDSWEEAITGRVLVTPVVVFVGLGSAAGVLTETAKRVKESLGSGQSIFFVDPIEPAASTFFAELGLGVDTYIRLGWIAFVRRLAARLLVEQVQLLETTCLALESEHAWSHEAVEGLRSQVLELGLLAFGRLRARWMLEDTPYLPQHDFDQAHLADLFLAVRGLERVSGTDAHLSDDGVVEYWKGEQLQALVAFASARGRWRWGAIEPRVEELSRYWRRRRGEVATVVIGAAVGQPREEQSPPTSILGPTKADNIIGSTMAPSFVTTDEIRIDSALARELIGV